MQHPVTYEHPVNERVRNLLRLEFLFRQAQHCQNADTSWDSRLFVSTLIDILAVLSRSDLKTEVIKELDRQQVGLSRLRDNSGVDQEQLGNVLKHMEALRGAIHATNGPLGQELRDNEFLTSIRQRSTIPGGTCDFDLPAYHQWLSRPLEARKADQTRWFDTLKLTRQGVDLLLKLIRNSSGSTDEVGASGGYQRNLETDIPYQLLRITVEPQYPYFVEISGGKHRFTVRFMERTNDGRPQQTAANVPFKLACCAL